MKWWHGFWQKDNARGKLRVDIKKDVRQIYRLSYFGQLNEQGGVELDKTKPEIGKGILVLKDPVRSWTDYANQSISYGFYQIEHDQLLLSVVFDNLRRQDKMFNFLFNLMDLEVRKWLSFVCKTQTIGLVNGPTGSTAECVNLHLFDANEQAKMVEALQKEKFKEKATETLGNTYRCTNCSKIFALSELRDDHFWDTCPCCKAHLVAHKL